jgi:hypothetical protein
LERSSEQNFETLDESHNQENRKQTDFKRLVLSRDPGQHESETGNKHLEIRGQSEVFMLEGRKLLVQKRLRRLWLKLH